MCCVAKTMDDPLATHTHTHPTPVDCLWLPPLVDVFDVSLRDPILLVVLQHELVASIFLTCRRVALSLTTLGRVALSFTITR